MGKNVDNLINNVVNTTGIIVELGEVPGAPGGMAGGMDAGIAGGMPPMPGAPAPGGGGIGQQDPNKEDEDQEQGFEGEEAHQNYINAVKDMKSLLAINPDDVIDDYPEIFQKKINNNITSLSIL